MVSAKLSELDSTKSFEQAIRRLGWFNTYSRQVLLCRYMLRQISSLNPDEDWMGLNHERQMLEVMRLGITVFSGVNSGQRIYSAPYEPIDRPETHFLKFSRSRPVFELSVGSGEPAYAFYDATGLSGGFEHSTEAVFEDLLFAHEVFEIGKGVSLSNKSTADQRAALLCTWNLWRDFDSEETRHCVDTLKQFERENPRVWRFWLDWYRDLVAGSTTDLDLQRLIALIPDEDWDQGPEHIAKLIEQIRAKFALEQEIASLKDQLSKAVAAPEAADRLHNQPPEPVEDIPARVRQDVLLVWDHLAELEEEIDKPEPSPSRLKKIAEALLGIAKKVTAYCAELGDITAKKAAEELGTTGTKYAIRGTAAYFAAENEGVHAVVKAIWEFAKTLPPG